MTRDQLLRPVLFFDAATCLAMGGVLVAAAAPIASLTDLPVPLLREAGILLFPFAAFVLWAARRGSGWPVQAVIAANIAWVATSLALVASPWSGNALGIGFAAAQAAAVALLAALQWRALPHTAVSA